MPMATSAAIGQREITAQARGTLCLCRKQKPGSKRTRHAPAQAQETMEATGRTSAAKTDLRNLVDETGRSKERSRKNRMGLGDIQLPELPDKKDRKRRVDFTYRLNKDKLRKAIKGEITWVLSLSSS